MRHELFVGGLALLLLSACHSKTGAPANVDTTLPDEPNASLPAGPVISKPTAGGGTVFAPERAGRGVRKSDADEEPPEGVQEGGTDTDEQHSLREQALRDLEARQAQSAREVHPRGSPSDWVTADDYPPSSLRANEAGVVGFTLDVDENGRATDCHVTRSSGYSNLDDSACKLLLRRARFTPKRDEQGNALRSSYSSSINWRLDAGG